MKFKNTSIALTLSVFFTMVNCFSEEITVDNPYKDISINYKHRYESCSSSSKETQRFESSGEYTIDENVDHEEFGDTINVLKISIILNDPKTRSDKILDTKTYNVCKGNIPSDLHYKKEFSLNGQKGYVAYTLEVQLGEEEGRGEIIKSIETKILEVSIDGVELPKKAGKSEL